MLKELFTVGDYPKHTIENISQGLCKKDVGGIAFPSIEDAVLWGKKNLVKFEVFRLVDYKDTDYERNPSNEYKSRHRVTNPIKIEFLEERLIFS